MSSYVNFLVRKKIHLAVAGLVALSLLLQFNNCSKISSQQLDSPSSSQPSNFSTPNSPVNSLNPYVLSCITNSDGAKISSNLLSSVIPAPPGAAVVSKLSSLDWNQEMDLIVTLDNACVLDSNFSDPVMDYIDRSEITLDRPQSIYIIKKESVQNLSLFIQQALASECLLTAEKNQAVKFNVDAIDPLINNQAHLISIGATDTYLTSLMALTPNGLALDDVKVAILDSGIDTTNPDLINMLARDASGNIIGKNSTDAPTDGFLSDSGFHGTHVAGLVGAQYHNSIAGSGVFGRHIKLYPIRASKDGQTLMLDALVKGIQWAQDQSVDLINMSVGTTTDSPALKAAIDAAANTKNVMFVVAAGNDGKVLGSTVNTYPAQYSTTSNGLITVGSFDATSLMTSVFSNISPTFVDIMSPGSNGSNGIISTVPLTYNPNGYGAKLSNGATTSPIEGTSMACPVVTGSLAAAISVSRHKFTNVQLKNYLKGLGSPKDNARYGSSSSGGTYLNLPTLINYMLTLTAIVTAPPGTLAISAQPMNRQAVVGEKIELSVSVVAPAGTTPTYQWYRNDMQLTTATSAKLTIASLAQIDGGKYRVQIRAGGATVTSQDAELKVALRYCN